jgi:hypothetical protein
VIEFIEGYMKINENSFKSKELLKQHNDETEEPLNLDLGSLEIKNYLLKNENSKKRKNRNRKTIQEN